MLNQFTYSLPTELLEALTSQLDEWKTGSLVSRIWQKNADVWTGDDEAKWLGWLGTVERELSDLEKYRDLRADAGGFADIVLLGMGGSSLCPEVLAETFQIKNFHILDSTVPAQIKSLDERLDLAKTLFIVASKSGSTLEPNTFKQYFYKRVADTVGAENAGRQFIAITDPGSDLQRVAERDEFRNIFFGDPEVGGRFSALTAFGMIPGAAMGIDAEEFLRNAREMADQCRNADPAHNPGAVLGAILGVCHAVGRDKLTIFTSPEIYDTGAWLEQLVAESTGKQGMSIIPIDREPISKPFDYGPDRIFAYLRLDETEADPYLDEMVQLLEDSDFPVVKMVLNGRMNLGQEFFRWEFATAAAGAVMKVNPFNQPDVESAKIETRKITEEFEKSGALPVEKPFFASGGIGLFSSGKYAGQLDAYVGAERSLKKYLEAHLAHIQENDYFALLAYIEMNDINRRLAQEIRKKVFRTKLEATVLGFGPRFLHSTGQAYKGGANNGVFLQITADDEVDFPVPGQDYTFGVVKEAQSRGDFQVLVERGRRALRVHICGNIQVGMKKIFEMI